jgi:hypothetical protein
MPELKLGKVIGVKGQPTINGEGAKQGQEVFELDELNGTNADELTIAGKSLFIMDETGDVSCTPTKFVGKGEFNAILEPDFDLEAMWENTVWEEIINVVDVEYEVENITATAGVRG